MIFIICPLCGKANGHKYGCPNAQDPRAAPSIPENAEDRKDNE